MSLSNELISCLVFQSLKSEYNETLCAYLLPSSQQQLAPYVFNKLKRNISENFHRWYFDAASLKGITSSPLLLDPSILFNEQVITRCVDSLQQTLTLKDQKGSGNSNLPPSRSLIEKAFKSVQQNYEKNFKEFQAINSNIFTDDHDENAIVTISSSTSQDENIKDHREISSSSSSSSAVSWLTVEFSSSSSSSLNQSNHNTAGKLSELISSVKLFSNPISLPIANERLEKLKEFFQLTNSNINQQQFLNSLFKVLVRYAALSDEKIVEIIGNDNNNNSSSSHFMKRSTLSGLGQHSAVPPSVMTIIGETMGVSFECFASPLNAHFPRFCSAFADSDSPFGSFGSFFDLDPTNDDKKELLVNSLLLTSSCCTKTKTKSIREEGISFELNPPFVEDIMEKARVQAEKWLRFGDDEQIPISFFIFLPHWVSPPTPCISNIRANANKYLQGDVVLAAGEHGYVDGSQHRVGKGSAQYNAGHESVVFVLQNELGRKKWQFTDDVKEKVKKAFADSVTRIPFSKNHNNNRNNNNNDKNRRQRNH